MTSSPEVRLAAIRKEIEQLKSTAVSLRDAPVPRAQALQRLDSHLDMLASRASFKRFCESFTEDEAGRHTLVDDYPVEREVESVLVVLFRDHIRALVEKQFDGIYSAGESGFTAAERTQRAAEIKEKIFALEVEEERLIVAAGAQGMIFARRVGADPAALLAA